MVTVDCASIWRNEETRVISIFFVLFYLDFCSHKSISDRIILQEKNISSSFLLQQSWSILRAYTPQHWHVLGGFACLYQRPLLSFYFDLNFFKDLIILRVFHATRDTLCCGDFCDSPCSLLGNTLLSEIVHYSLGFTSSSLLWPSRRFPSSELSATTIRFSSAFIDMGGKAMTYLFCPSSIPLSIEHL